MEGNHLCNGARLTSLAILKLVHVEYATTDYHYNMIKKKQETVEAAAIAASRPSPASVRKAAEPAPALPLSSEEYG